MPDSTDKLKQLQETCHDDYRTVHKWLNEETGRVPRNEIARLLAALFDFDGLTSLEQRIQEKLGEVGSKPAQYSIERHGKDWVLYFGRDDLHHGANLCTLSEFDAHGEATRQLLVDALNNTLGNKE